MNPPKFVKAMYSSIKALLFAFLCTALVQSSFGQGNCCGGNPPAKDKMVSVGYQWGAGGYFPVFITTEVKKTYKGVETVLVHDGPTKVNVPENWVSSGSGEVLAEPGATVSVSVTLTRADPDIFAATAFASLSAGCAGSDYKDGGTSVTANLTLPGGGAIAAMAGKCVKSNGSVRLAFGLGDLPGNNVGTLWMEETDLQASTYTPSALHYTEQGGGIAVLQGSDLKQVLTPSCLAHVETITSDSFEVRFFERSKVGALSGGLYSVTGGTGSANSFVTWRISNPGNSTQGEPRIRLEEIRGGVVVDTTTWTEVSGGGDWDISEGNDSRIERKRRVNGVNSGDYTLTRTVSMKRNGVETVINEQEEVYQNELLVSLRRGPAVGGIVTTYTYDANGKRTSMQSSDGPWEIYGTTTIAPDVHPQDYVVRPFLDLPFASGGTNSGRVSWSRFGSTGTDRIEKINGSEVKSSHSTNMTFEIGGILGSEDAAVYPYLETDSQENGFYRYQTSFQSGAPNGMAGWPLWDSDERRSRTYEYRDGTIDGAGNFTESAGGPYRRQLTIDNASTVSTWVPGLTVQKVTVYDAARRAVVEDEYECTASDTFTLMSRTLNTYDDQGRRTLSVKDGRTIYACGYNGDHMAWEEDEAGTRTEYSNWDFAGRPLTVVRKGYAGNGVDAPAQADRTTTFDYDGEGRQLSETVTSGTLTTTHTWSYDTAGRLTSESVNGVTTSYAYGVSAGGGRQVTKTLPGNLTEITTYYRDGQVKSVTGTAVVQRSYTYGIEAAEPNYTNMLWAREEVGDASTPGGVLWKKTIRDNKDLTRLVESPQPNQQGTLRSENYYDTQGELIQASQNGTIMQEFSRDDSTNSATATQWIDAIHNIVTTTTATIVWDAATSAWYRKVSSPDGESWTQLNNFPTDPTYGKMVIHLKSVDAAGAISENWEYVDRTNKLTTSVSLMAGASNVAISRTRNGLLESEKTQSVNALRVNTYDGLGRLIATRDPRTGLSTILTYNTVFADQVETTTLTVPAGTDPAAGQSSMTSRTFYLASEKNAGRVKTATTNGSTTYSAYSDRGELVRVWGDTYPLQYVFDTAGRLGTLYTYRTAPDPNTLPWPPGDATTLQYCPGTTVLLSKTDALNRATTYTYDSYGRVDTRLWARNVLTDFDLDYLGRVVKIDYSDSTPDVQFSDPDSRGRYQTLSDGAGTHTLTYNSLGVMTSDAITAGLMAGTTTTVTPGIVGRTEGVSAIVGGNTVGAATYGFDSMTGRLNSVTIPGTTISAGYSYLANSDLLGTTDIRDSGNTRLRADRVVDGLGRLHSFTQTNGAQTTFASDTYGYDFRHRPSESTRADGNKWSYGYNTRNEVISGSKADSSNTPLSGYQYQYAYDAIGNRDNTTTNGRFADYTANALNQYTSREVPGAIDVVGDAPADVLVKVNGAAATRQGTAWEATVTVNNASGPVHQNIEAKGYKPGGGTNADYVRTLPTTGAGREFVSQTPESFTYDLDGNLTGDGRWNYTWDAESRLTQVEAKTNVPTTAKKRIQYSYDAQGRMVERRVWNWDTGTNNYVPAAKQRLVYFGWQLLAEFDVNLTTSALTLLRSYVWGIDGSGGFSRAGGVGGLIALRDASSGDVYLPSYDGNGNILGLVKAGSGDLSAQYEYGPYGEPLRASGPMATKNPFQWSTKYSDPDTGKLYFGFRFYSPGAGRWLGRDPMGEYGGANIYGFADNQSIHASDYLGLWKISRSRVRRTATATAEAGDTIRSLARIARLQPEEYGLWVPGFEGGLDDPIENGCSFSIPNTIYAVLGYTGPVNRVQRRIVNYVPADSRAALSIFATWMKSYGYYIDQNPAASRASIENYFHGKSDVVGFFFAGHGGANSILPVDENPITSLDFISIIDYRLSIIYLESCKSALPAFANLPGRSWLDSISIYGAFYGFTEDKSGVINPPLSHPPGGEGLWNPVPRLLP